MAEQVHGHDVMKMMIETGVSYTRETLREAIGERFGAETRFFTCSAEGMTAEELISFLEKKGKFVDAGSGMTTTPERICNH